MRVSMGRAHALASASVVSREKIVRALERLESHCDVERETSRDGESIFVVFSRRVTLLNVLLLQCDEQRHVGEPDGTNGYYIWKIY